MKTIDITPSEYASFYGCSLSNITKHLRNDNPLAYVIKVKKYSRFYVLVVPENIKELLSR